MLESDSVDAVYIPLPTGVRAEWAIRAAQAGKHVMGEKPSGVHADEVKSILAACQQRRSGRTANGGRAIGVGKDDAAVSGKAVQIRRLHLGIAAQASNPIVQIVDRHKQHIARLTRLLFGSGLRGRRGQGNLQAQQSYESGHSF